MRGSFFLMYETEARAGRDMRRLFAAAGASANRRARTCAATSGAQG